MPANLQHLRKRLEKVRVIDPIRGCWHRGSNSYGRLEHMGRNYLAHRLAAHIYLGFDIDSPLQINHKCNNPRCFNPEHLYIGTQSENQLDIERGDKYPCGHNRTDANTYIYTSPQGKKYKWCKMCRNKSRR